MARSTSTPLGVSIKWWISSPDGLESIITYVFLFPELHRRMMQVLVCISILPLTTGV